MKETHERRLSARIHWVAACLSYSVYQTIGARPRSSPTNESTNRCSSHANTLTSTTTRRRTAASGALGGATPGKRRRCWSPCARRGAFDLSSLAEVVLASVDEGGDLVEAETHQGFKQTLCEERAVSGGISGTKGMRRRKMCICGLISTGRSSRAHYSTSSRSNPMCKNAFEIELKRRKIYRQA